MRKMNDVTGSRMRRQLADDVKISGNAVMLMGVWTFVKVFARSFFARQELYEQLKEFELPNSVILLVMFIMLTVFGAVFMLGHALIGYCAHREASGKRTTVLYLIVAVLLLLVNLDSVVRGVLDFFAGTHQESTATSLLIDMTLIYALLRLIIASVKLRRLQGEDTRER